MARGPDAPRATVIAHDAPGALRLALTGRLDAEGIGPIWDEALDLAADADDMELVIDLSGVSLCDMAGAAFLLAIEDVHGAPLVLEGDHMAAIQLLERARKTRRDEAAPPASPGFDPIAVARAGLRAAADGIAFLGEAAGESGEFFMRRSSWRGSRRPMLPAYASGARSPWWQLFVAGYEPCA